MKLFKKKNQASVDVQTAENKTDLTQVQPAEVGSEPQTELQPEPQTEAACTVAAQPENTEGGEAKPQRVIADAEPTKKQKYMRTLIRWSLMTFGIVMMSCSVYFFQVPNNFTLGGVAGLAILLKDLIAVEWLTQGVIMAIINVFLLILGLIILGKQCTIRTIYCTLLYTGLIWLLEIILPLEKPLTAQWVLDAAGNISVDPETGAKLFTTGEPFLELVYTILTFGVGGAIVFYCGASSGGTDIIALIMKKYTKLNVGVSLMIIDFIVVLVSIYTFTVQSVLFSVMGLFVKSFLLDGVIESIGKTKYITIITTKPDEIATYILDVIKHGYTIYDAEGGYTHEPKKVLITICKRGEALKLKTKVKELDDGAFVIITDANEILGKGFGGTI